MDGKEKYSAEQRDIAVKHCTKINIGGGTADYRDTLEKVARGETLSE
jgi:hypothetical protein